VPNYEKTRIDLFFELTDVVNDHVTLKPSLDLDVDEIKYNADMLGLEYYEREATRNICVYPHESRHNSTMEREIRWRYVDHPSDFLS
jgi:hypothetical protein